MTLPTRLLCASTLLVLACDSEGDSDKEETGGGSETATDTADTAGDTGKDTDTGFDTGDTSQPVLPDSGYFGPPIIMVLADDGAGGAKAYLVDPTTNVATVVPDLSVSKTAVMACAGQMIWALDNQGGSVTDNAYGVEGRTIAISKTLALGAGFAAQSALYTSSTYWFGGLGSASLLSFDDAGTAGASVDLSSLADSDGSPEVTRLLNAEGTIVAILRRQDTTKGSYEKSMVAKIDLSTQTITSSGTLAGMNAGRTASGVPGGVAVEMLPVASDGGGIEMFDLTANASGGRSLEYGEADRIASFSTGNDGTSWVALREGGTTAAHHYLPDGSELDSGFTVAPTVDALAAAPGYLYVGEGSTLVPYSGDGAAGSAIAIGSKVLAVHSCQPPSRPPDTGDTAVSP